MKALQFNIPMLQNQPLRIVKEQAPNFYAYFHYHEEIQISLINKGAGTLLLGHQIRNFNEGSVIVIGKDIPHLMQKAGNMETPISSTNLYFKEELFGLSSLYDQELKEVNAFFKTLRRGLLFTGEPAEQIKTLLNKCLLEKRALAQLALVLQLTDLLMCLPQKSWLSSVPQKAVPVNPGGNRMEKVINYTLGNRKTKITVAQAAQEVGLSESRFSRVFKKHTGLTYVNYLNKLRIEDACAQLQLTGSTISEIAYQSGFDNISNFNKVFRQFKGQTPTAFRKNLLKFPKYAQ
jgi:AraC-like DNA-binding protein